MINYFIYLPNRPEQSPWECTATAIGHERVLPGSQYPPRRHPVDHHFTWEDGRVLHAYQILYITEGKGYFESGISHKRQQIDGGCIVILFPGIWRLEKSLRYWDSTRPTICLINLKNMWVWRLKYGGRNWNAGNADSADSADIAGLPDEASGVSDDGRSRGTPNVKRRE